MFSTFWLRQGSRVALSAWEEITWYDFTKTFKDRLQAFVPSKTMLYLLHEGCLDKT